MAGPGFGIPWPIVWGAGGAGGGGVPAVHETVIATTNYSLHPINCMMAGNVPLGNWERVTIWNMPDGVVKNVPTASKTGVTHINMAGKRIFRGGWQ